MYTSILGYSRFEPFDIADRLEDEWRSADSVSKTIFVRFIYMHIAYSEGNIMATFILEANFSYCLSLLSLLLCFKIDFRSALVG